MSSLCTHEPLTPSDLKAAILRHGPHAAGAARIEHDYIRPSSGSSSIFCAADKNNRDIPYHFILFGELKTEPEAYRGWPGRVILSLGCPDWYAFGWPHDVFTDEFGVQLYAFRYVSVVDQRADAAEGRKPEMSEWTAGDILKVEIRPNVETEYILPFESEVPTAAHRAFPFHMGDTLVVECTLHRLEVEQSSRFHWRGYALVAHVIQLVRVAVKEDVLSQASSVTLGSSPPAPTTAGPSRTGTLRDFFPSINAPGPNGRRPLTARTPPAPKRPPVAGRSNPLVVSPVPGAMGADLLRRIRPRTVAQIPRPPPHHVVAAPGYREPRDEALVVENLWLGAGGPAYIEDVEDEDTCASMPPATYDEVTEVYMSVRRREPQFPGFCYGFLYATQCVKRRRVAIPYNYGVAKLASVNDLFVHVWVPRSTPSQSVVDRTVGRLILSHFPGTAVPLEFSYSIVYVSPSSSLPEQPNGCTILRGPDQWYGNILVVKHGKRKPAINMEREDTFLVDNLVNACINLGLLV
ncbi:hypothetical protein C8R43DRAFT_1123394 [Mycena crocata]|nr:hypothetical protein C8R43DRAFT_1123394 [Mycena crocata]